MQKPIKFVEINRQIIKILSFIFCLQSADERIIVVEKKLNKKYVIPSCSSIKKFNMPNSKYCPFHNIHTIKSS